jgi:hypothetical protein
MVVHPHDSRCDAVTCEVQNFSSGRRGNCGVAADGLNLSGGENNRGILERRGAGAVDHADVRERYQWGAHPDVGLDAISRPGGCCSRHTGRRNSTVAITTVSAKGRFFRRMWPFLVGGAKSPRAIVDRGASCLAVIFKASPIARCRTGCILGGADRYGEVAGGSSDGEGER